MNLSIFLSIAVVCLLQPAEAQSKKKLYYSDHWEITTRDSAHYYRVCMLDTITYQFVGEVNDYLMNNQLVMKGFYNDGKKNGEYLLYFPNGQIESQGQFQNDKRFGAWKYYFPNGNIWREVTFSGDDFFVNTLYDTLGKKVIDNGTGKWEYEYEWPGIPFNLTVSGHFENGKKQGEWQCSAVNGDPLYIEMFSKNEFVKGILFENGEKTEYVEEFQNKFLPPYKFQITEELAHSNFVKRKDYPFLTFLPFTVRQVTGAIDTTEAVFTAVDQQAEFDGGFEAMAKFLDKNMRYPPDARRRGIQGTVFVSFIVNTDGSLAGIDIVKGVYEALDKEALRVVSLFPNWIPAMYHDKIVRSRFVLPIKFKLAR